MNENLGLTYDPLDGYSYVVSPNAEDTSHTPYPHPTSQYTDTRVITPVSLFRPLREGRNTYHFKTLRYDPNIQADALTRRPLIETVIIKWNHKYQLETCHLIVLTGK